MGVNGGGLGGFGGDIDGFGGLMGGFGADLGERRLALGIGLVWGAGSFGYLITRAANTIRDIGKRTVRSWFEPPEAEPPRADPRACGRLPPEADSPEANLGAFRTMSGLHRCVWIIEWTGMG